MLPDFDGCVAILAAVGRQWARDARQDPAEFIGLASWLDLAPNELKQRLDGRSGYNLVVPGTQRVCPGCGQALPAHNDSPHGAGRKRIYCSARCRLRLKAARVRDGL